MSETEDSEAGMIVKTVKETCAEGLVVTGGGKEGIFIKEVKPDSPASKHLTAKEGDQILSATVFFDNVSYEDALQILEHAQPYKMELCLRRKMESTMLEDDEIVHPESNERGSPAMRSPRKKKHQDRISWPKFPSFGKGHRAQFKRSHSTSEAEEHKKLEMSPPTSDTESPLKSPLKSPGGKDKKKKQKIKMKMKSPRSMSVEESQRNQKELTSENLIVLEDEQVGDILDEKLPEKSVTKVAEISKDDKEGEYGDSSKIVNEVLGLSGMESQHRVHLISLSNTLKTTDISDALAEASADDMMTSDEGKIQRSEMKFSIFQKDQSKIGVDSQSTTILEMSRIPDPSAHDTIVVSHGAISQAEGEASQLVTDFKTEVISKDSSEINLGSRDMKMSMHKLDVSADLPDIGVLKQSPRPVGEKQWKEGTIFENEIYGIRTRGPLADIVTSKSHFTSPVNGLQFTPPDSSEMIRESNMSETITVISQPQLNDPSAVSAVDAKDPHLEIKTSRLPTESTIHGILAGLDKKSESKFKAPKVDLTGHVIQEPVKMTHLPKREDIEIPGMEDKKSRPSLQTPGIKVPKIEKIINITKDKEIQAQQTDEEFNVEDVKEAVSKFPALKLPEGDITGVLVQREITIMEMKGDKTSATPRGSPRKISGASADSSITVTKSKIGEEKSSASHKDTVIKIPKVEPPYADEQTVTMTKIDYSKPNVETQQTKADKLLIRDDGQIDVKFKLPKREDIEIPGMEAIEESTAQKTDMKVIKDQHHTAELQGMYSSLLVEQPSVQITVQSDIEMSKRHKTHKHGDKKGQEKKSKKPKVSMPGFGITKPDIRFPDVGIEIPKNDVPAKKYTGEIREKLEADVPHSDIKPKDISHPEHTDLELYRMENTSSMLDQKTTDDFQITVYNKTESINLTEFDDFTVKAPKAASDISVVDVQDIKLKQLAGSADIKCPEKDKEGHFVYVDMKAQDIKTEGQGRKFKLPKFEISFPEVKAPKISASKKEDDSKTEVPATHGEMPYVQIEKEADLLELHSKGLEMKVQRPTFQFPKFGFSKSQSKEKEADMSVLTTDISILEGSTDGANTDITATVCDAGQKDESKVGASINVELPSIRTSKLEAKTPTDISAMEVHVKGPEEELKLKAKPPSFDRDLKLPAKPPSEPEKCIRDTQVKLAAEPQSADIKALEMHKEKKSVDMKAQDIQTEGQLSKFKLPKFGIKLPEIKTPKIDLSGAKTELEISLPERKAETHSQDEVQDVKNNVKADVPELDSRGSGVKAEQTNFSFHRFGFSKSEVKISDTDVNLPNIDVSLPEGRADLEKTNTNITVSIVDTGKKDETKSGYPAKFKIPSITLPKFGTKAGSEAKDISAVDAQAKGTEISLKEKEIKLSAKVPDVKLQEKSVDMKPQSIQNEGQGSKFTLPKFGINLPEVKGPKIGSVGLSATKTETDISLPEVKMEVHPPDIELQEGVIEVEPEIDSKGSDVSLPKGNVELEGPNTDITLSMEDTGQKDETKFDSPTKFKLPSITLPKFGAKAPKGIVEISAVDVQAKGPEISLQESELKFSAEPLSVDIKRHDVEKEATSLRVDMRAQDIQTEGQGIKLKLPKFGINLPEVKGPNIHLSTAKPVIDISLPEGKTEVHPPGAKLPEGAIEVKDDMREIEYESVDVKTKGPSFSLPKFGISKSEIKAPEADASLPIVDVSLPEVNAELEGPKTDITVSMGDTGQKFGSPTKFKLPSITLPTFGAKTSKEAVEISAVDVQGKGYDISLPEAELKLSAELLSVDIKGLDVELEESLNVDMKAQDFEIEEQGRKFKLPKFGISLPEVTGEKVGSSAAKTEIDISVPEGKMEVHPPDAKLPEGAIEVKANIPEIDSKGLDVKTKGPSFSFPKFGFSKSEVKDPKADASIPVVDVSLPQGKVELEGPNTDITVSMNDTEQKDETKFGSPTKFKLPSITLPKFGAKAPKGNVDIPAADLQAKGPEISLSEAEFKLTTEPLSVAIKGPDVELEKSLNVDMKAQDIQTEGQGIKFKLPKFGISLPEVKGPKIGSSADKPEIDISLPEGKMEGHPPDAKLLEGAIEVKADIPEIDSESLDVKTKRPSFSFPKFGFSKSEMKAPKADASLPVVDVSLQEGNVELEGPNTGITGSMGDTGQKDETKFGSPTKFKLPSITLPKFGAKAPKGTVELSAVDVQGKGYDISLPEAELKLSAEPLSVDIKGPDVELKKSLNVDMKAQDFEIEQQGSKFKLPKFGISLPEVKGPKIDSSAAKIEIDISVPEGKMEVHPPDAKLPEGAIEVKANLPEIDSESLDVKTKGPGLSFPKFGFSKSEIKDPKAVASLPVVDVSLPEGKVEREGPKADITVSMGDTGHKDETKFGSPTKFKLPSITLPKFGAKAQKGNIDIPAVDVQAKGPEISLPEAELKLSAEPLSVDIKGPDLELEKSLNVDVKAQDIQTEGQGIKFKLPKFGINLPEVKGPKIGSRVAKTEIDISLPEGKMEVHPPDAKLPEGAIDVKADTPEIDSKGLDVKAKRPSFSFPKFGFSKSEVKAPKTDASLSVVDVSLPQGKVELEEPIADITVSMGDTGQKDETKFGSPTKFKLPSITLPKAGAKAPKGTVEISTVDVQGKGYDISLPEAELKLSAEPLSADIMRPDLELKEKTPSVDVKAQDIQTEGHGSKFKLPKFGISLPEVTGPKVGSSAAKTEIDISLPKGKMEVHPLDAKLPEGGIDVKADIPEIDSKGLDVKYKGPSFSFPKFGFSKSETKAPKADVSIPAVDVSLPEGKVELEGPKADITVSMGDTGQKDETKFGSPTKFKLPSITLPKFGAKGPKGNVDIPAVHVQAKVPEISLPEAELKLSAKPLSVDVTGPDVKLQKSLNVDVKAQDIPTEEQGSTFKLPKFGIGLPEVTGPKVDSRAATTEIDISLPEGKMEVHPPDAKLPEGAIDVEVDTPKIDSKGLDVKTKGPSFSFPKFGFSKSEVKAPKADASFPVVDVSFPEGEVEFEGPNTDITVSMGDTGQKDETKFGSPTKFKLPSITLPKFGAKAPKGTVEISTVDVHGKGYDISLPEAELKLTPEPLSADITRPDLELKEKSVSLDVKAQDIQNEGQGMKFKLPKFGIGLPEVKGPKISSSAAKTEIDIYLPEGKMEVHPPDVKLPEGAIDVKANIPEIDSKGLEVKTKRPSFSFPKFGFSKSEIKDPKADASLPAVDVSLPEGNVELEGPNTDITVSVGDTGQKDETKFGSPTKFKLPSITLPKFGAKTPKGNVDIPAADLQAKGPDISLPETELELSAKQLSVDIKGPDVEKEGKSLRMDMKAHDIQTEGQGMKFKLPKFGISLPEVKGPKIDSSAAKPDIDISLPEGKMKAHPPDAKLLEGAIEVKADIPEIDSESLDVKTKSSSFSFPKFGFSKSEVKDPKADASLPAVDVSLSEGKVEFEGPKADITASIGDTGQKDETKFGSPTKFKLPSITLPKFGAKVPTGNADIPNVDVQAKGPEISLPEAELKLSAEPLSVDIKGPDVELEKSLNVDVKAQDIQTEGQGIKFKLPKFGIGLPEVKGPKISSSAAKKEIDISLSEPKMQVHPPDAKLPEGAIEVKADKPKIDSKGLDVKTKGPSFSFPKFGFSKSEIKAPKADASIPAVDVSLPEGKVELEGPKADITVSMGDTGQKDETKFGSPTKFKLPSITLPKFGAKVPTGNADIPDVDLQVKGPEISLPEAELKLSAEPLSVDIKGPDVEIEKSLNVDVKAQDIQIEEQGIKFKLPKFGINLPEVKGPKIGSSEANTEIDISLPEAKMQVHQPDAKLPEGAIEVKVDKPKIDSKGLDVKTKGPSFSFPKFGFSKSEIKAPKADASIPAFDVSLSEGKVELEGPKADITVSVGDTGQKDETKFGSPTKFKLPSITLPKFGAKVPTGNADIPDVDVQAKGPEISLPEAELKLSAEPLSVDTKGTDVEIEKSLNVDVKAQDIQIEEQGIKFKLPKFGISLPEVKGPKIGSSEANTEIDISLPEVKMQVHPPDAKLPEGAIEVKADKPKIDSKGLDVKTKGPIFSFPKFGFSKSEIKAPKAGASIPAVDVSLPEGKVELEGPKADITVSVGDTGQKDETKFGSPTKFKLPSITLPKFGAKVPTGNADIPVVDLQAKGPEISLPEAELKLSAEPLSVAIKGPDVEIEKSLNVDVKAQDIQIEEQGIKFKLPKFGISLPEVKGPKIGSSEANTEIDISLPEAKMQVHPPDAKLPEGAIEVKVDKPKIDSKGLDVKTKGPSFSFPKFGFSKSEIKAPKADTSIPAVDVSLPEGKLELEGPKADITVSMGDTGQKDETKFGSPTKFKLPSITLPKFGAKAPKGKVDMPAVDVQIKGHDISLPDTELALSAEPLPADVIVSDFNMQDISLSVDMKAQNIHTEGQGSKFKLPKFGIGLPEVKGPRAGLSEAKKGLDISLPEGKMEVHPPNVEISEEISVPEKDIEFNACDKHLKLYDSQAEVEIKGTIQKPPETAVKTEQEEQGTLSKFKLPTIKMSKITISKTKSQDGDNDTGMRVHVPEAILESKHKEAQGQEKSSKFTIPTLGNVLRGFDVEFNVPTLDETERAKTETAPAKQEFHLPSEGGKIADSEANLENNEKEIMVQTDQKPEDDEKQTKPEKSSWFRFPKFSSPTKTVKVVEKESSQPSKENEESSVNDNKEREPELSSARETEEDSVSPTLSLRSSDAFADVSSAQTTEQVGLSLTSPTKVKVKYSESRSTVEIGDLHGDIITSTARTKLITMEPHQPEKVNIPCSSEMSSSSVDTMRQLSGEIHIIVSNVQNVPSTQHTTIITNVDTQDIQSLPLEGAAMQSDTVLSVQNTRVQKERHTVVERHIVKEMSGEEKVFVTRRTQVFEGDSVEPISDDAAFSIQKLRDTVRTEKMRFFESAESNEQNAMSDETCLKYIDSSTEENEGK
ncbi:neuroblast differentiation-associated protein AHNAK-like isoform X2 [Pygocentrus nattereri]|uniref:PDZ domain-containing protein n=2 Tax=Pygocentrus nattereri TaxID=42514 RepID=A0AAR2JYM3_PYGNA|nr:neuroblast differentiation-associated protein AHNAK-like isoform X2 [Pygocentrus nattereri]